MRDAVRRPQLASLQSISQRHEGEDLTRIGERSDSALKLAQSFPLVCQQTDTEITIPSGICSRSTVRAGFPFEVNSTRRP